MVVTGDLRAACVLHWSGKVTRCGVVVEVTAMAMAVLIVLVAKRREQGADEACALRLLVLAVAIAAVDGVASIVVRLGCEERCVLVHLLCLLHQVVRVGVAEHGYQRSRWIGDHVLHTCKVSRNFRISSHDCSFNL